MRPFLAVALICPLMACAGKSPLAYDALEPYAAESPLKDTHVNGVPKDPLAPDGMTPSALPSTRPDQDAQCVLSFSISGGGSNSAAFAWGALEELNNHYPRPGGRSVLQEIDYISSASGGGIAGLMLLEVLREHRLREHAPLTQAGATTYMQSARFRGVLDQRLVTSKDVGTSALFSGAASTKVRSTLRMGVVGTGTQCAESSLESGPLERVPKDTSAKFKRYVTCKLTNALTFDEVFVPADRQATLPAFLPAVTLFESGDLMPATSAWLKKLGVEQVQFALLGSSKGDVESVDDLDYVDAVTLSMSFPGIGPVLAVAKHGSHHYGVTLADAGQSDNLGLWLAYAATRNELQATERRGAVHVVLDSAFEPATPFAEEKLEGLESVLLRRVISNGDPLLRVARNMAKKNLDRRLREGLRERAASYEKEFVSAEDVLKTQAMTYHKFMKLPDSCLNSGLPTDRDTCLKKAEKCVDKDNCRPRDRFRGISSSLSNSRQRAEDLMTLGQEAMARALHGTLRSKLDRCFGTVSLQTTQHKEENKP